MNQAFENTIALLLKNEKKISQISEITWDTIKSIEECVNDSDLSDVSLVNIRRRYYGLIVVKIDDNGGISYTCKAQNCITKNDEENILKWIKEDNKKPYAEDYFRVDLTNYILLFKVYKYESNNVLIGHILKNSTESKIDLLEARQDFLMRNFL